GDLPDVLGAAVQAALPAAQCVGGKAELRRDHDAVAHGRQGFAHQFLVGERAVYLGGIEECDAAIDGSANQGDALLLLDRLAVGVAEAHATQAHGRHFETAPAEPTLFHDGDLPLRAWNGTPSAGAV